MLSFLNLIHPINVVPIRNFGISNYFHMIYPKFSICKNRNEAVLKAKENGATWMLFLDSDMTFPQDIIMRLLSHQEPIVAGMYWHQSPPHMPVIYKRDEEKGRYHYTHFIEYPRSGLFEVDLTGMGCMLVKMEVFDNIELPYFDYRSTRDDGIKDVTEDVVFHEKVLEAGYKVLIDPTIKCGHIRQEEVDEAHFDSYMTQYKTAQALLEEYGDGEDDDT